MAEINNGGERYFWKVLYKYYKLTVTADPISICFSVLLAEKLPIFNDVQEKSEDPLSADHSFSLARSFFSFFFFFSFDS